MSFTRPSMTPLSCRTNLAGQYTANEGLAKILYKCLVSIFVFPEIKLLFTKQKYNALSRSIYTHISVRDLYIYRISQHILLEGNMWTNPGNIFKSSQTHECGNWDWGLAIPKRGIYKWDFPCSVPLGIFRIFLMKKNVDQGGAKTALHVRWGIPVLRVQLPAREGWRVQDHQGLQQEPSLPVHRVGTSE
jgi:hypothetical protein